MTSFNIKRLLAVLLAALFILILLYMLIKWLTPLFFGIVFSFFLYPASKRINHYTGIPFSLCILLNIILFVTFAGTIIFIICYFLINEAQSLIKTLPERIYDLHIRLYSGDFPFSEQLSGWFRLLPVEARDYIKHKSFPMIEKLSIQAGSFVLNEGSVLAVSLPSLAFTCVVTFFTAYFLTNDPALFIRFLSGTNQKKIVQIFNTTAHQLYRETAGYVGAQLILSLITFMLCLIGLIILHFEHPLLLAFLVASADLIPIAGSLLLFAPVIIYCLLTGQAGMAAGAMAVYVIIFIVKQLIEPKIIGQRLGIHPFTAFLILYLSVRAGGWQGVLWAPAILITAAVSIKMGIFQLMIEYIKKEGKTT
ncbi:AI-2E family transporter [Jeotgalibacillus sp. R-1-5s-1]|uniref:AI-2E family transporter n=1 Tax=Jeotgalibacillus sp. R-1-5s-1 TaxID=2555897 RepID=UPI00106D4BDA|nr:AI-2E family transporter [Jeotgalibacillus sp. R-1-5s-1]TFD92494.1 AI-2E family transporter [Jeotgalibacillus sp. R-1-5s-1]